MRCVTLPAIARAAVASALVSRIAPSVAPPCSVGASVIATAVPPRATATLRPRCASAGISVRLGVAPRTVVARSIAKARA